MLIHYCYVKTLCENAMNVVLYLKKWSSHIFKFMGQELSTCIFHPVKNVRITAASKSWGTLEVLHVHKVPEVDSLWDQDDKVGEAKIFSLSLPFWLFAKMCQCAFLTHGCTCMSRFVSIQKLNLCNLCGYGCFLWTVLAPLDGNLLLKWWHAF